MELRILPSNIANMIAAGEVVQRPSSVVKELMENAVDAGATQVTVVITDSGRTLIQVIDNGCGMTPDDAVLCFERHATSKIATAEDLNSILTFGFRGEALASIAAVADVTLKTRREEDEVGCIVEFSDSQHISTDETACPKGSNFAVRNLFFNVPARRKFLKSDNVEFKHIIEEFTRIALTRPEIGFSLTHNGKDVYVLRPAKGLKFRILDLLGSGVVGDIVNIDTETSLVHISGFVGKPDTAKKTLGNQFFFVNGRFFKSAYMHKAVMKAYESLIPDGVTPSYFIFMEVDPHSIDVNIHPTKTEIKFEEDSVIFQILYACVKETLGKNAFGATIDFEAASGPQMPIIGQNYEEYHPISSPSAEFDPNYNPFEVGATQTSFEFKDFNPTPSRGNGAWNDSYESKEQSFQAGYQPSYHADKPQDYSALFEDKQTKTPAAPEVKMIILQGKYIITPSKSGLMAINIRRANERIMYEKFLKALSENQHVTQTTLFPVQVQVGPVGRALFDEYAQTLSAVGFDIAAFGTDTIVVNGVPEGCSAEPGKVQTMVQNLMLVLSDEGGVSIEELMKSSMAEKLAILASSGSNQIESSQQAQNLVDTLFSCENPETTSNGRKIMTIITTDELDKKL